MSLLYILENHGNKEEKWRWERRRIGKWRQREKGEYKDNEIKHGQVLVREMNWTETVFITGSLPGRCALKRSTTKARKREREES